MRRVLVLCTANRCRSPMAAALIQARLAAEGRAGEVAVDSAGTWAPAGLPPIPASVEAMAERGLDISAHRSREVRGADMVAADLVLVMTDSQLGALASEFPEQRGKLLLMAGLLGGRWDVADPVGQPLAAHRATAGELARLVDAGWARILGQEP